MKEKFQVIKTIHLFLVSGVAIAYFLLGDLQSLNFLNFDEHKMSDFIYLLVPVIAIVLGNYLYKDQMQKVDKSLKIEERTGTYQTASLIHWAVLEGAAFFILFYKTEYILFGLLLIVYIIFLKPSENKMIDDFRRFEN